MTSVNGPADRDSRDGSSVLLRLGRAAGIGGIAVGGLVLLFQGFIRQTFFPSLLPDQAFRLLVLFLLFSFGTAIGGLVIWASQKKVRSFLIVGLVLFAAMLVTLAVFLIPRASDFAPIYKVRVTALSSKGIPIEEARVWSSLGGEPKRVAGGWEFEIPSINRPFDGRLRIFAEHQSAFEKGEAEVQLDNVKTVSVVIQLVRGIDARLRGIVLDSKGRSISGARVLVIGYPNEASVTGPDGGFSLSAHSADGQIVQLHVEKKGLKPTTQFHPAGETPVTLILRLP